MNREQKIIKVSIFAILENMMLVIFKAIVGFLANSIAIILDAVNNLSDALSSIITIIGTKLSSKKPDKEHPYGHGRIEYLSALIIAVIVLIAGLSSLKESAEKIIYPVQATYSVATIIVVVTAIFVKLFFGRYMKKQGEYLNSSSLVASGIDSISDSVIGFSTLVAAIVSLIWKISIEGYIGVIISLFILKSAIEILKSTTNNMIGTRADGELTKKLRAKILTYSEVLGVYDLILHNYGPNNIIGTAHIQVDDETNAREIHRITREIAVDIYSEFGIIMTIGIYASNNYGEYDKIQQYINSILQDYKNVTQMHGFYVDEKLKNISFDLIFSFDELSPEKVVAEIVDKLKKRYGKYAYSVIIDRDYSD